MPEAKAEGVPVRRRDICGPGSGVARNFRATFTGAQHLRGQPARSHWIG
jgi:hypothetical protein